MPLNEARKPRSGVGLNDLLGRTEGVVRTRQGEQGRQSAHAAEAKPVGAQQSEGGHIDNPVPPAPIVRNHNIQAAPGRKRKGCGSRQAPSKPSEEHDGRHSPVSLAVEQILLLCGPTPELSRAAKRHRLERVVRAQHARIAKDLQDATSGIQGLARAGRFKRSGRLSSSA